MLVNSFTPITLSLGRERARELELLRTIITISRVGHSVDLVPITRTFSVSVEQQQSGNYATSRPKCITLSSPGSLYRFDLCRNIVLLEMLSLIVFVSLFWLDVCGFLVFGLCSQLDVFVSVFRSELCDQT